MKSKNQIPYILSSVVGEFCILMAAVLGGTLLDESDSMIGIIKLIIIFITLCLGVFFRYFSEKYKDDDENNPLSRKFF